MKVELIGGALDGQELTLNEKKNSYVPETLYFPANQPISLACTGLDIVCHRVAYRRWGFNEGTIYYRFEGYVE